MNIFTAIALGGETASKGLEDATGLVQTMAGGGDIPDSPRVRAALTAWGIPWGAGDPIHQMFTSVPTIRPTLPAAWSMKADGGGHFILVDGNGAERISWYVHGWDPITPRICDRFSIRTERTGARTGVMQVVDGNCVVHVVRMQFAFARVQDASGYWATPEDEGTRQSLWQDEDVVKAAARREVRAWLDHHAPGWDAQDPSAWNAQ